LYHRNSAERRFCFFKTRILGKPVQTLSPAWVCNKQRTLTVGNSNSTPVIDHGSNHDVDVVIYTKRTAQTDRTTRISRTSIWAALPTTPKVAPESGGRIRTHYTNRLDLSISKRTYQRQRPPGLLLGKRKMSTKGSAASATSMPKPGRRRLAGSGWAPGNARSPSRNHLFDLQTTSAEINFFLVFGIWMSGYGLAS